MYHKLRRDSFLNKTELVGQVATKTGMTKKDIEKVVNAFFDTVQGTLQSGDKVQLIGFGTFEPRDRQARKGRNPQTGEEIDIPATRVPAFKAGKALKDALV
ncbi:MAG: HU family DNA-binding protein [Syntrophomonadaceae bacterium]|nr:HU family DNA-binding protein [Syntrophomonadaceae bacterium]MDD3889657.1 HU family DNA-binding protein [Syntrophomonadaceae bacterium]MDD4548945.1 HU family DNA-binding protein [Syntrophomonadaceae bacterium]